MLNELRYSVKVRSIHFIALLIFAVSPMAYCQMSQLKGARVEFSEVKRDFVLKRGIDKVPEQVAFSFRNVGDELLQIQIAGRQCATTKVELSKESLKPGEAGNVLFSVEENTFQQDRECSAIVQTNDNSSKNIKLTISVRWVDAVSVSPGRDIVFRGLNIGGSIEIPILIERKYGSTPLNLSCASDLGPNIALEYLQKPDSSIDRARLKFTLSGTGPARLLTERVSIKTGVPECPEIMFTLSGIVEDSAIRLDPWKINLGNTPKGSYKLRHCKIELADGYTSDTLSAKTDVAGLKVNIEAVSSLRANLALHLEGIDIGVVSGKVNILSLDKVIAILDATGTITNPIIPPHYTINFPK